MTGFDHFHTLLEVRQGKMRRMKTLIGTLHNETARVKQLLENLEFAKKVPRAVPLLLFASLFLPSLNRLFSSSL